MRHVSRIQLHCPETDFQNLSLEGKQYQSHQARPIPREEPVIQMILFVTRLMWVFENFFPGARGYIYALRMRIEHNIMMVLPSWERTENRAVTWR